MTHFLHALPYPDKDMHVLGHVDRKLVGEAAHVIGDSEHILGKSLHPDSRRANNGAPVNGKG